MVFETEGKRRETQTHEEETDKPARRKGDRGKGEGQTVLFSVLLPGFGGQDLLPLVQIRLGFWVPVSREAYGRCRVSKFRQNKRLVIFKRSNDTCRVHSAF